MYIPKKTFNIAGQCVESKHYMLPATERLREVERLVYMNEYFILHAPRQCGKTTTLKAFADKINNTGDFHALYVSLEGAQGISDAKSGIPQIIYIIAKALEQREFPQHDSFLSDLDMNTFASVLNKALTAYCKRIDKPLVIFFDEADCLSDNTLISFLRQLREGYIEKDDIPFPISVALMGLRSIRDYKARVRPQADTMGTASPFNITSANLTLKNFTRPEIKTLYLQHTTETGQQFDEEVFERAYYYTSGQPWLVNALMNYTIAKLLDYDLQPTITATMIDQAAQIIIKQRDPHIDSLLHKLKEERISQVIEPIVLGEPHAIDPENEDFIYACELGLIGEDENREFTVSNRIYKEVIIRYLNSRTKANLSISYENRWMTKTAIDIDGLLGEFQEFWRENSEILTKQYKQYTEAAPHLVIQAFMQRVFNGGAYIIREFAAGRKRMDLCVEYKRKKYPIELKLLRKGDDADKLRKEAIRQTVEYMNKVGCKKGSLVIFDKREDVKWDDKIYKEKISLENKRELILYGC